MLSHLPSTISLGTSLFFFWRYRRWFLNTLQIFIIVSHTEIERRLFQVWNHASIGTSQKAEIMEFLLDQPPTLPKELMLQAALCTTLQLFSSISFCGLLHYHLFRLMHIRVSLASFKWFLFSIFVALRSPSFTLGFW